VRFSLFYNFDILPGKSLSELYQDVEQQAIVSDALGFDAIWFAEHHFDLYGRMPNPLLFLARLSSLTKQIDLGTAIVEAPYYNPLRLAEDAALLDRLSNGRVRLGIGSGAGNKPTEFQRFGIPLEEKTARAIEITEILRQAFDEGQINFSGTYYQYRDITIQPRPVQAARDLIWLATGKSTAEVAGRNGYSLLLPRVGPAERQQLAMQNYRAALDQRTGFISLLRFVYVAATEREAQAQTQTTIQRYAKHDLGIDWDGRTDTREYAELLQRLRAVVGNPQQVIAQLRGWQAEIPFDEIMCQFYAAGMRQEDSLRSLQLLGREVLPVLQSDLPISRI
jgi:alkanesulfonate monooxygenase SsuD/methylene tetrahydromethanopterin reductase-like flavin-dependent oxidoreductase (luciferase family)